MKNKSSLPTMKDVAAEAGVALGTVSKVFNGIPVGESYRLKVEEAAKKLGYQVNNYARAMRTNKTNTIAIIIPQINHPFFSNLTEFICRQLSERNYSAYIAVTDRNPEAEDRCIRMVSQHKADGIIALTYNPNLENVHDIPFISIDRTFDGSVKCISSDNYSGGQIAAAKLVQLGCKKLLFARNGSFTPGETDKRGAGFENWCQKHGVPYESFITGIEEKELLNLIEESLKNGTFDFDGIFCCTDKLLYQIRDLLHQWGLRVPQDVQMIGFDGINDFWTGEPICSTIVQPLEQIAKLAVDSILNFDNDTTPRLICLPVRYHAGPTTKDGIK
ncbi:MAG: LacI family DNA-binding transcriptional regulator [Erysipelotrichaceae bacterium]|nr:LacI family DNA-binding transcriptional regulator [Erysipelotrichaceae bacterium]